MKTKIESIPCTFGQIYVGNVFENKDNHIYMKIDEINFSLITLAIQFSLLTLLVLEMLVYVGISKMNSLSA